MSSMTGTVLRQVSESGVSCAGNPGAEMGGKEKSPLDSPLYYTARDFTWAFGTTRWKESNCHDYST